MTPVIAEQRGQSFDISNMLRIVRTQYDAKEPEEAGADRQADPAEEAAITENEIQAGSKHGDSVIPSTRKQDYPANDPKLSSKK